jgi:hypothetical protein
MGHADIATTERYLHFKARGDEAELLAGAFGTKSFAPDKPAMTRAVALAVRHGVREAMIEIAAKNGSAPLRGTQKRPKLPVKPLALDQRNAAMALDMSPDHFRRHIAPLVEAVPRDKVLYAGQAAACHQRWWPSRSVFHGPWTR